MGAAPKFVHLAYITAIMSKIRIKYFGPIRQGFAERDGWLDLRKVTMFIGNQGSGKSTVAKLVSTFTWLEKALTRGDFDIKWVTRKNRFKNIFCAYHRLNHYFEDGNGIDNTVIEYVGFSYSMKYDKGDFSIIERSRESYPLPQIMYIPAERNFISTIRSPKLLKLPSESLMEFISEFDKAKFEIKGGLKFPINNTEIEYDKLNDVINIRGKDYKVRLTEASSGFQSSVPLYLVSWFLANSVTKGSESSKELMSGDELRRFKKSMSDILSNDNLTNEQRRVAISILSSKFNKTAFINIVEEPEQNLYPGSQRHLLNRLIALNNQNKGNQLILTTHSPYLINYLTLAVKAFTLTQKIEEQANKGELYTKLDQVVPLFSIIDPSDWVIYELDDAGNIMQLKQYDNLPSDENILNLQMGETNELFSKLLEIEDLCQ